MAPQNPPYTAAANRLTTVPMELVHQVLSDLDANDVLMLLCTNDVPYLDACVCSHITYGNLLSGAPGDLDLAKGFFKLYMDVSLWRGLPTAPRIGALERRWSYEELKFSGVLGNVKAAIIAMLTDYVPYVAVLNQFVDTPVPPPNDWDASTPEGLRTIWMTLLAAEEKLNSTKYYQLSRLSELLKEYPGVLRQWGDNSQEPRQNHQSQHHWVQRFSNMAEKIKAQRGTFAITSLFQKNRLPWVPYDRFLRLFLKVLKRFPVQKEGEGGVEGTTNDTRKPPYPYPPDVARNILTAINGMAYVYLRPLVVELNNPAPLLRTLYTPYSAPPHATASGLFQPKFVDSSLESISTATGLCKHLPFDEREVGWLEAFLASCRFMSRMEDVKWVEGSEMTVAEYWTAHGKEVGI